MFRLAPDFVDLIIYPCLREDRERVRFVMTDLEVPGESVVGCEGELGALARKLDVERPKAGETGDEFCQPEQAGGVEEGVEHRQLLQRRRWRQCVEGIWKLRWEEVPWN